MFNTEVFASEGTFISWYLPYNICCSTNNINPPKPETFFASEFDDFCKCCSYVSLEKGLGEKYFFFNRKCVFLVRPKTSI